MRIFRLDDEGVVASAAADLLAACLELDPEPILGLSTGRTMIPFYDELARRHRRGELDLSGARAFNVDELLLPPEHPASFHSFMERHAWERIGLDRRRCDIPDPTADPAEEAERYDRAIAAAGGFDLVFLGVGADGHVAYNLPGGAREETHVVEVPAATADTLDVPESLRPLRALTIGFAPLHGARHLALLATTEEKARPVRELIEGPEDLAWPCTLLRGHPHLDVLLAPAAARELRTVEHATA